MELIKKVLILGIATAIYTVGAIDGKKVEKIYNRIRYNRPIIVNARYKDIGDSTRTYLKMDGIEKELKKTKNGYTWGSAEYIANAIPNEYRIDLVKNTLNNIKKNKQESLFDITEQSYNKLCEEYKISFLKDKVSEEINKTLNELFE